MAIYLVNIHKNINLKSNCFILYKQGCKMISYSGITLKNIQFVNFSLKTLKILEINKFWNKNLEFC